MAFNKAIGDMPINKLVYAQAEIATAINDRIKLLLWNTTKDTLIAPSSCRTLLEDLWIDRDSDPLPDLSATSYYSNLTGSHKHIPEYQRYIEAIAIWDPEPGPWPLPNDTRKFVDPSSGDNYTIGGLLGAGSYGSAWLTRDDTLADGRYQPGAIKPWLQMIEALEKLIYIKDQYIADAMLLGATWGRHFGYAASAHATDTAPYPDFDAMTQDAWDIMLADPPARITLPSPLYLIRGSRNETNHGTGGAHTDRINLYCMELLRVRPAWKSDAAIVGTYTDGAHVLRARRFAPHETYNSGGYLDPLMWTKAPPVTVKDELGSELAIELGTTGNAQDFVYLDFPKDADFWNNYNETTYHLWLDLPSAHVFEGFTNASPYNPVEAHGIDIHYYGFWTIQQLAVGAGLTYG